MKYGIKCNGTPKFFLKYEGEEWNELKDKLVTMGLKLSQSVNIWGTGNTGNFYREHNNELKAYVQETFRTLIANIRTNSRVQLIDDINAPFSYQASFNIAIFRAEPTENVIELPINKFLTVLELNELGKIIALIYQCLFNIVVEAELSIERR